MKVAIVHYWFITRRGGEKVVESILKIFPKADIYTLFYDPEIYGNHIEGHKIFTSNLNRKLLRKYYQKIFPLYPIGIKSLQLKEKYDLIISSESGPAKGISIPKNTFHICYIHSPMRYCWGFTKEYLNSIPWILRPLASYLFGRLREWDITTINNVNYFIANSFNVSKRVQKFYHRQSEVVHPPISLDFFETKMSDNERNIYLSFGAITPYKRIDLLIETFNKNEKPLIIIGDGSERTKLEKIAKDNIVFLGPIPWSDIQNILEKTEALIFPGEEDFGMIPLEVMAHGIPVLAYNKGGALETVVENLNKVEESSGLFFEEQTIESIQGEIDRFELIKHQFDRLWIRNHARKFGEDFFLEKLKTLIEAKLNVSIKSI